MKKQSLRFAMVVLLDLALAASMLCTGTTARCNLPPSSPATSGGQPNLSAVERPSVLPVPCAGHLVPLAPSDIAQVWANDGGDKVTRDELRATGDSDAMCNSVWDGTGVSLFGGRNEVVAFNLVLEAPALAAANVDVSLTSLVGPAGASITTRTTNGDGVFGYTGRNIELFYVRYLEIKGLSTDLFYTGYDYDERHVPERCRRPHDGDGNPDPGTGWEDRPCHNKLYPEIAVPLELHSPFTVPAGANQSIWGDVNVPKTAPARYVGSIAGQRHRHKLETSHGGNGRSSERKGRASEIKLTRANPKRCRNQDRAKSYRPFLPTSAS